MDAFAGAIGVSDSDGKCTPEYIVCKPRSVETIPGYFAAILRLAAHAKYIEVACSAVRERAPRLRYPNFGEMLLPVPPPREQAAILRYLNNAGRRLDAYIRSKKKLIALLNEQRQAIIGKAVTRSIDPDVRLKPSGAPWLGEIVEHWRVLKLGHVAELIVSNVDKHSHETEQPVRLCNYTDVYKNRVINANLTFMHATATRSEISRFKISVGDVIITKDSEVWDDIGVPALVAYEAPDLVCGYHLTILRPRLNELRGEYLLLALQHRPIATHLHIRAKGVTRFGLSQQAIRGLLLPLPPLNEQARICEHVSLGLHRLDATIDRADREITLLTHFRTRLVADVVTGQLDVREAARNLSDEFDTLSEGWDADDLSETAELDSEIPGGEGDV